MGRQFGMHSSRGLPAGYQADLSWQQQAHGPPLHLGSKLLPGKTFWLLFSEQVAWLCPTETLQLVPSGVGGRHAKRTYLLPGLRMQWLSAVTLHKNSHR